MCESSCLVLIPFHPCRLVCPFFFVFHLERMYKAPTTTRTTKKNKTAQQIQKMDAFIEKKRNDVHDDEDEERRAQDIGNGLA